MDGPYFSIIILARGPIHLLPSTVDTILAQSEQAFEVVVVSKEKGTAPLSPGVRFVPSMSDRIPEMMNEGSRSARGRYLQFLDPGDRFLSQQGLFFLKQLIQENGEPHLVYGGVLMRGPDEPPQAVTYSFNRETLQKGMFPSHFRSSWIRRDSLLDLGGFDERLSYRPGFDFFCRLYRKENLRVAYSRRVLTDAEPRWTTPKEMAGYLRETCRILYRHFGLWPALRWIFVQDHLKMARWTARLVKQAFWKTPNI